MIGRALTTVIKISLSFPTLQTQGTEVTYTYRLVIILWNRGSTMGIPVSDGVLAAIVGLLDSEIGANSR